MAHQPEDPTLYVCSNCHVVHAGIHDEEHEFRPPTQCGACDSDEFYVSTQYPKHPEA